MLLRIGVAVGGDVPTVVGAAVGVLVAVGVVVSVPAVLVGAVDGIKRSTSNPPSQSAT